jgi:hypothetical protein
LGSTAQKVKIIARLEATLASPRKYSLRKRRARRAYRFKYIEIPYWKGSIQTLFFGVDHASYHNFEFSKPTNPAQLAHGGKVPSRSHTRSHETIRSEALSWGAQNRPRRGALKTGHFENGRIRQLALSSALAGNPTLMASAIKQFMSRGMHLSHIMLP